MKKIKDLPKWPLLAIPALALGYYLVEKDKVPLHSDGFATLTWTVPSENNDDSALTDLAGYKIQCWTLVGDYSDEFYIADPKVTSFTVEHLSPGTHYCAVKAVNMGGVESALSNVVTKVVM